MQDEGLYCLQGWYKKLRICVAIAGTVEGHVLRAALTYITAQHYMATLTALT